MEPKRIFKLAQFLIQVSVAILPIGAGASGLIAQQLQARDGWGTLIWIWLGLGIVIVSVYLNLAILQTELRNPSLRTGLETNLRLSILCFMLGIAFMLLAPVNFVIQSSKPTVTISHDELTLPQNSAAGLTTRVVISAHPADEAYRVKPYIVDPTCVSTKALGDQTDQISSTFFSAWEVTIQPGCPAADYVVAFNIQKQDVFITQKKLTITVAAKP